MGDMADWTLDQIGDDDYEDGQDYCPPGVTCKYCGHSNLTWYYSEKLGWRLYYSSERILHDCLNKKRINK